MTDQPTPRAMIKALLRGERPPRPLLMPIIFGLGARLENLSLREFYSNPTRIANALRQVRSVLKVDGVTCYFDPYLEAEALGCKVEWGPDGKRTLAVPSDGLRETLASPESVTERGRLRVVRDVLQRLTAMLKDEPALMVRVTGPLTLARQLCATDGPSPPDVMDFAAETTAAVAKHFVESGADVVLLMEDSTPELSSEAFDRWTALLEPVINVIRFYDALPVLLLTDRLRETVARRKAKWDCVFCLGLNESPKILQALQDGSVGLGVALPLELFAHEGKQTSQGIADCHALLFTSAGDLPPATDLKHLQDTLNSLRLASSRTAQAGTFRLPKVLGPN